MAVSITNARQGADGSVRITLTPADIDIIACAIRTEVAAEWEKILAAPLPGRKDILRIRAILDVYERLLETFERRGPSADLEIECPASQLDVIAHDLLGGLEDRRDDHRVAVCAMVQHLLTDDAREWERAAV